MPKIRNKKRGYVQPKVTKIDYANPISKGLIAYYDASPHLKNHLPGGQVVTLANRSFVSPGVSQWGLGPVIKSGDTFGSSGIDTTTHPELSGTQPLTFMSVVSVNDSTTSAWTDWRWSGTSISNGYFLRALSGGSTIQWIMNGFGVSDRVDITGSGNIANGDLISAIGLYHPSQPLKIWLRKNNGIIYYNESAGVPTGTYSDSNLELLTDDGDSDFHTARLWNRALADSECRSLLVDPYQLIESDTYVYPPQAAGGNFTLNADSGNYTYSGTAADLVAAVSLVADSGTYTYSGTAADLKTGYNLAVDSGTYTYTGTAAALTFASAGNFTLSADTASYTLSGTAASLTHAALLTAATDSYDLTGTAVGLTHNYPLSADSGTYTYAGTAVDLDVPAILQAETDSYTFTGSAATLTASGQTWVAQSDTSTTWTKQTDASTTWTEQ